MHLLEGACLGPVASGQAALGEEGAVQGTEVLELPTVSCLLFALHNTNGPVQGHGGWPNLAATLASLARKLTGMVPQVQLEWPLSAGYQVVARRAVHTERCLRENCIEDIAALAQVGNTGPELGWEAVADIGWVVVDLVSGFCQYDVYIGIDVFLLTVGPLVILWWLVGSHLVHPKALEFLA